MKNRLEHSKPNSVSGCHLAGAADGEGRRCPSASQPPISLIPASLPKPWVFRLALEWGKPCPRARNSVWRSPEVTDGSEPWDLFCTAGWVQALETLLAALGHGLAPPRAHEELSFHAQELICPDCLLLCLKERLGRFGSCLVEPSKQTGVHTLAFTPLAATHI